MNATLADQRRALLRAAFAHIPNLGWNRSAFERAAQDQKWKPGRFSLLFPKGITDTLEEFQTLISDEMRAALAALDLPRSVHQRIHRITCERFAVIESYRPIMLQAMAASARLGSLAPALLFRSSSDIWRAAGDTATGTTYYSKRWTLSAVLACGLTAWAARPYQREECDAFLQRRLRDVATLSRPLAWLKKP